MFNLLKPEYLWRPPQIVRRLTFKPSDGEQRLALPWRASIWARTNEDIWRALATQGVYDLPVTEAIFRLVQTGDTTLDLGANIGYMSLVLAKAAGPTGSVIAFEPNPNVIPTFEKNVRLWASQGVSNIQIKPYAVGAIDGEGTLGFPEGYSRNQGIASLNSAHNPIQVPLRKLDSYGLDKIGLMKIDVEGFEASVFLGAKELLEKHRIRDIIFEEHEPFPAGSHMHLLGCGYSLFRLTRSALKPLLLSPHENSRQNYLPPNYLATIEPNNAMSRFKSLGWQSLK